MFIFLVLINRSFLKKKKWHMAFLIFPFIYVLASLFSWPYLG